MTACGTGTYNLCINQGATYTKVFVWTAGACPCGTVGAAPSAVDLTGYTATMQFRPFPLSTTLLYDASSNITLGGVNGTITLVIPAANTETFTWWQGVYDLLLTDSSGNATRLLMGSISVSPGVST
jgi:hypothetical protein